MRIISEAFVLLISFVLYWSHRERRKYLKKRIGCCALSNVYQVARNVAFMLRRKNLNVRGATNALKKGCILYSYHFGVWESMPRMLNKIGYSVGIIVNKYSSDNSNYIARFFDKFLFWFRSTNSVKIFYKEDVLKITHFLKNGGVLGMLVDGNTFHSKFNNAKRLSRICGVPLVPFAAYRMNGTGVLEIGCDLDGLVMKRRLDYMWFYKSREKVTA